MQSKRQAALKALNELRRKHETTKFKDVFRSNKKHLSKADSSLLSVCFIEDSYYKGEMKEAARTAKSMLETFPFSVDLKCLLGSMYYEMGEEKQEIEKNMNIAHKYLSQVNWTAKSEQFYAGFWTDGTAVECMDVSLELLIASIYLKGDIEFYQKRDPQTAEKTWKECWKLIKQNATAQSQNGKKSPFR